MPEPEGEEDPLSNPKVRSLVYLSAGILLCMTAAYVYPLKEPPKTAALDNPQFNDPVYLATGCFLLGGVLLGRGVWGLREEKHVRAALGLLTKATRYLEEASGRIPPKYNALTYVLRAARCVQNAAEILREMEEELEKEEGSDESGREGGDEEGTRETPARGEGGRENGADGEDGERGGDDGRGRPEDGGDGVQDDESDEVAGSEGKGDGGETEGRNDGEDRGDGENRGGD